MGLPKKKDSQSKLKKDEEVEKPNECLKEMKKVDQGRQVYRSVEVTDRRSILGSQGHRSAANQCEFKWL